jgi:hypothetical protein
MPQLTEERFEQLRSDRKALLDHFSDYQMDESMAPKVLQLLCSRLTVESLSLVKRCFTDFPGLVSSTTIYFKPLFHALFDADPQVRTMSLELLDRIQSKIANSPASKEILKDVVEYTQLLSANANSETMLPGWGLLLVTYGAHLHKTSYFSPLLAIAEVR